MSFGRMPLLIGLLVLISVRYFMLDIRPIHHDESVNGWFVDALLRNGYYDYDPGNYHGPLFFYFLAMAEKLFGRNIEALRSVPLFFGTLLTLSPLLFRKWIGERASWIASFALALSPAVVFYSRYAIHEVPFALGSVLILYYWLQARERSFQWRVMLGLGGSLAFAATLKENFIILGGCILIAELMVRIYERNWTLPERFSYYLGSIVVFLLLIGVVFSGFGMDTDGVSNFFAAFNFWSETGSKGNGHEKPIYYWLKILSQYEWTAFAGFLLAPLALKKVNSPFRLLSVVTMGVFIAYSIVSYKTPWCLLSFHWGLVMIFAYWESYFHSKTVYLSIALITLLFGHSAFQAYQTSFVEVDSDENPYVYGQTYREFMPPIERILEKAKSDPVLLSTMRIAVISDFTWPLPYLFGEFKKVGFYTIKNVPPIIEGEYVFIDEKLESAYRGRLIGNYTRAVYRARQWASPMVIYTRQGQ